MYLFFQVPGDPLLWQRQAKPNRTKNGAGNTLNGCSLLCAGWNPFYIYFLPLGPLCPVVLSELFLYCHQQQNYLSTHCPSFACLAVLRPLLYYYYYFYFYYYYLRSSIRKVGFCLWCQGIWRTGLSLHLFALSDQVINIYSLAHWRSLKWFAKNVIENFIASCIVWHSVLVQPAGLGKN